MSKLTITRGLPGSGKTTWANEQRAVPVSRDDFRRMFFGGFTGKDADERVVTAAQRATVNALLRLGLHVIVHDTNLPQRYARDWRRLALLAGAEFDVHDLSGVPLEVCLSRNEGRRSTVAYVPPERIREWYANFIKPLGGKPFPFPDDPEPEAPEVEPYVPAQGSAMAIMVDLDGTAALMCDRSPYDETRVEEDRPNPAVVATVRVMHQAGYEVIFCSGRTDGCREATERWITRHIGVPYAGLYMRKAGDGRKDSVVKLDLFNAYIRPFWNVQFVLDDRDQVVQMWRSLGLTVFQVAEGNF